MKNNKNEYLTWEDLREDLEKIVTTKNTEFNESFNKARITTSEKVGQMYLERHPKCTKEEFEQYMSDYLAETPDELMRQFRIYSNTFTSLFNMMNVVCTNIEDMKQLYILINQQKLDMLAKKEAKEIARQELLKKQAEEHKEEVNKVIAENTPKN
jgi:hypothetical protein